MSGGPTYYGGDVGYLVVRGRYLRLMKARGAESFLRYQLEAARDCRAALLEYPTLRIELLGWHYACLLSLGALDDALFVDFTHHSGGWRGVVWAGFLAVLDPRPSFEAPLEAIRERVPHNQWLVDAALAEIRGEAPAPAQRLFVEYVVGLRELLFEVPRMVVPLRRTPTPEQSEQIEREREAVRRAYHQEGPTAARALLPGTLLQTYLLDYPEWIQATRRAARRPSQ